MAEEEVRAAEEEDRRLTRRPQDEAEAVARAVEAEVLAGPRRQARGGREVPELSSASRLALEHSSASRLALAHSNVSRPWRPRRNV